MGGGGRPSPHISVYLGGFGASTCTTYTQCGVGYVDVGGKAVSDLWRAVVVALFGLVLAASVACASADVGYSFEDDGGEALFLELGSASQNQAAQRATPMPPPVSGDLNTKPDSFPTPRSPSDATTSTNDGALGLASGLLPILSQDRLIVRTVDMTIEVNDVAARMENISGIAARYGGWVVDESRYSQHVGAISIRVASAQLDAAVRAISALGTEVLSFSSTSQDVTEEYVDVQARVDNLLVTRESLRELLQREGKLQEILEVQREITRVSADIEVLLGRRRFLEQTSATSLITVDLELAPGEITVDAGPDLQAVESRLVSFRATFPEPTGIESYEYWWDFGDGLVSEQRFRTAVTEASGQRITEIVRYTYHSADESPYFVTFNIRGAGDAGVVVGEDSLKVNVERVPIINIATERSITIRTDREVTLTGTATWPENVSDLSYTWQFGDGLQAMAGTIDDAGAEVTVTHRYAIARRAAYEARFTVTGTTEFGAEVSASSTVLVHVQPSSDWVVGFPDIGETSRAATRVLSVIAQGLVAALLWAVLLSPVWVTLGAIVWFLRRRTSLGFPRRSRRRREEDSAETNRNAEPADASGEERSASEPQ